MPPKGPKRLDEIADVELDGVGKFKYIQILVKDKVRGDSKLVIRGYAHCAYHADILDEVKSSSPSGFTFTCPGGGRIDLSHEDKTIFIFGYSQAYGQPDHRKSVDIVKKYYPDYEVTYSNEGY
uniref:Janus/Ocnus n=1 Tax=Panagrellus redivivus TaxID=6233 RepID=A0A7E4ZSE8_PANRE